MNTLLLPVAALFISILLIVIYFCKKNVDNKETKIYSKMLIVNLIYCILAIVTFIYAKTVGNEFVISLFQKVYMILMLALIVLILLYNVAISEYDEIVEKKANMGIWASFCIFSFFILVAPINVINYDDIIDGSGLSYSITLFATIIYLIFIVISSICIFIKNKNLFTKDIPFIILIFLYIIGLFLRTYFPSLMFENFFFSFILLIMYHTIENPDVMMIDKLEIAKDQADKANKAKTDFLSSMSHEIRTPLNAIVGFSSCIESSKTLEEAKENAKDIVNASNTLLEIVNGVLDISKIEAGKLEITNSNYNPNKKFMELADLMRSRILEKGIDFQVNIASDLPTNLYGDHVNLKKVVSNLLSNACKYTDKGFIKYDVSCVNQGDVCRLIISVEDSGRGIKKENISKLFTKFQRLEEDRNTTIEGTGLGLAITKKITELMGGQIILHTVYGEGSKFTVVVNQKIDLNHDSAEFVSYDMFDNKKHFSLADKKILVVDDNNLNLKVSAKILEKYHAKVVLLDSGFKCIESIQNGDYYDLILMDDMMPKMSGTETLQKLRNIKGFNIPTIALTANAIEGMREKYLANGFDDYLAKPINKSELKKVLNRVLYSNKPLKKADFGELPSSIYEIGNHDDISIAQPIVHEDELIEVISDDSDYYDNDTNTNNSISDTGSYDVNYLKENHIDVDHALSLLGDMDMYHETMKDFMNEITDKFEKIKQYKESNDMKNYSILVHSLKSDAKYLGFMDLADISYQHELKSKENDFEFVKDKFDLLEQELMKIINVSNEYLKHI